MPRAYRLSDLEPVLMAAVGTLFKAMLILAVALLAALVVVELALRIRRRLAAAPPPPDGGIDGTAARRAAQAEDSCHARNPADARFNPSGIEWVRVRKQWQ